MQGLQSNDLGSSRFSALCAGFSVHGFGLKRRANVDPVNIVAEDPASAAPGVADPRPRGQV